MPECFFGSHDTRLWLQLSLGGSVEGLECLSGGMPLFSAAGALGGSVEVLECLLGGLALFCGSRSSWGLSGSAGVSLGRPGTVWRQPKPLGPKEKCWSVSWEACQCLRQPQALGGQVIVIVIVIVVY